MLATQTRTRELIPPVPTRWWISIDSAAAVWLRLDKDEKKKPPEGGFLVLDEFGMLFVARFYFSEVLIESNLVLRFEPRPFTTAMIASEIPAAIRPYSMAVAPDSSDKNLRKIRCKSASC